MTARKCPHKHTTDRNGTKGCNDCGEIIKDNSGATEGDR